MKDKTLREVCEALHISRRTIQGYEEAGLIRATGKNKYGYLLYNEEVQRRIADVRFYQELGFTRKEIREILSMSRPGRREKLQKRIDELETENKRMRELMERARAMLAELSEEEPDGSSKPCSSTDQ